MPDLLLRNARIWTGDPALPRADAALVRDGRFAFVGREQDANVAPGTEALDARGRFVLPGFIDGHVHLHGTGAAMRSVDLKDVPSVEEAVRRVSARAAKTAPGAWVQGAGWEQHYWPGAQFPHRRDLDDVTPVHPVVLAHTSGHCVWVNSAALRAAGVTRGTPVPEGGAIDRGEDGEPSGILRDEAMRLIYDALPRESRDETAAAIVEAQQHAHSLGITSVHAMNVGRSELRALEALREEQRLSLRVTAYLASARLDDWAGNRRSGDGDDTLRTGGVKFFADGAIGSMTAWMLAPYEGSDDTGLALLPPDELERQVVRALESGLAPAIHAIGDRANPEVLDILERARGAGRHRVRPAHPRDAGYEQGGPGLGRARTARLSLRLAADERRRARVRLRLARGDDRSASERARRGHAAQRPRRAGGRLVPTRADRAGGRAARLHGGLRARGARGGPGPHRARMPRRLHGPLA